MAVQGPNHRERRRNGPSGRGAIAPVTEPPEATANDRLKSSWGVSLWGSLNLAVLLHVGLFALWPELTAQDFSFSAGELEFIELPPEIRIPPPPEAIARPMRPVISTTQVDADITIGITRIDAYRPDELPTPPDIRGTADVGSQPVFTPMTVRPEIKNRRAVEQALEREYPALLRDAGIGGTTLVWFFIDEDGVVRDTQVRESSGHRGLDGAALEVAGIIRFSPALNRDKRVPVWISLPITFRTR